MSNLKAEITLTESALASWEMVKMEASTVGYAAQISAATVRTPRVFNGGDWQAPSYEVSYFNRGGDKAKVTTVMDEAGNLGSLDFRDSNNTIFSLREPEKNVYIASNGGPLEIIRAMLVREICNADESESGSTKSRSCRP